MILAASLAPTARNVQPWEFVVITDKKRREELSALVSPNGSFVKQAPACLAVLCRDTKYYLEDGAAATTQALLCATALGLGTCWIAGDKKEYADKVRQFLGAPDNCKLVSLIAVGYAAGMPSAEKRPLETMIHWGKF